MCNFYVCHYNCVFSRFGKIEKIVRCSLLRRFKCGTCSNIRVLHFLHSDSQFEARRRLRTLFFVFLVGFSVISGVITGNRINERASARVLYNIVI